MSPEGGAAGAVHTEIWAGSTAVLPWRSAGPRCPRRSGWPPSSTRRPARHADRPGHLGVAGRDVVAGSTAFRGAIGRRRRRRSGSASSRRPRAVEPAVQPPGCTFAGAAGRTRQHQPSSAASVLAVVALLQPAAADRHQRRGRGGDVAHRPRGRFFFFPSRRPARRPRPALLPRWAAATALARSSRSRCRATRRDRGPGPACSLPAPRRPAAVPLIDQRLMPGHLLLQGDPRRLHRDSRRRLRHRIARGQRVQPGLPLRPPRRLRGLPPGGEVRQARPPGTAATTIELRRAGRCRTGPPRPPGARPWPDGRGHEPHLSCSRCSVRDLPVTDDHDPAPATSTAARPPGTA